MQEGHPNPGLEEKVDADQTVAASPPEADTPVDTTPSIEEMLKAAELKAAEHHDAWLRAKAETENVRRRAQEDVTKAHKFAAEKFAGELLAVKDSLEAALLGVLRAAQAVSDRVRVLQIHCDALQWVLGRGCAGHRF